MSKKTKNEVMNEAVTVGFMLGMKAAEQNGVKIEPKNGRRIDDIDGFITYRMHDESGADFMTAIGAYFNAPYEHEFEKAEKKSAEKRELARKAREAIASQFKM